MSGGSDRSGAGRARTTYVVAVVVLVAALGAGWLAVRHPEARRQQHPAASTSTPAAVAAPRVPMTGLGGSLLRPKTGCQLAARRPFVPTGLGVRGVTRNGPVLALARDAEGVPGTPPISDTGKREYAWDAPGIRPGSRRGNVLMNAHTWPDGTALGNALLAHLHRGDVMVLRGHGAALCYRVTERLEVRAAAAPLARVYDFTGRPQLVMIVCSGRRLGPGNWENRTIWFASPVGAG